MEIRDAVARFNERHTTPLRTRIGLHVGQVALGPVGREYHVVGDVPNSASRIEGLNKQLGTTILASGELVRDLRGFCLRPLGRFVLPGRTEPLDVVEILGREGVVDGSLRELGRRFSEALAAFEAGDVARAATLFHAIARDYPSDGPARYYHRLCSDVRMSAGAAGAPAAIRIDMK